MPTMLVFNDTKNPLVFVARGNRVLQEKGLSRSLTKVNPKLTTHNSLGQFTYFNKLKIS